MRSLTRRAVLGLCLAAVLSASSAATANATLSASPTSLDFPAHATGTTSASRSLTLTLDCSGADAGRCYAPICFGCPPPPAVRDISITISPTGSFSQTNNCGGELRAYAGVPASCTINVSFSPQAVGATAAILSSGNSSTEQDVIVPLSGTGKTPFPVSGHKADALKRCKTKHRKRARKKCRKNANHLQVQASPSSTHPGPTWR
jgi:hypothetical protein